MDNWVYYNGKRTNDFGTLAGWFQKLKDENERLKREYDLAQNHITENEDCIHSMSHEIIELQAERGKTNEVLKRYCGDSVDAPIPTMVGLIIDDFFCQQNETEHQVKALQKAEKTIDKLNTELVVYTDKVAVQGEWIVELEEELKQDDKLVAYQREQIKELEKRAEKLEKRLWDPDWCRLIDKLNEMIDKEAPIPRQLMKVYTNAEDEIWDKLNYLAMSLSARNVLNDVKNERIRELENKVNDLDVTNRRLKLENEKLKDALEFCQKEASFAREHAHNVEVNAERIRKGLDKDYIGKSSRCSFCDEWYGKPEEERGEEDG